MRWTADAIGLVGDVLEFAGKVCQQQAILMLRRERR